MGCERRGSGQKKRGVQLIVNPDATTLMMNAKPEGGNSDLCVAFLHLCIRTGDHAKGFTVIKAGQWLFGTASTMQVLKDRPCVKASPSLKVGFFFCEFFQAKLLSQGIPKCEQSNSSGTGNVRRSRMLHCKSANDPCHTHWRCLLAASSHDSC